MFMLSCAGSGLETGWSPTNCNKHSFGFVLNVKKPEGLVRQKKYGLQQMFKSILCKLQSSVPEKKIMNGLLSSTIFKLFIQK